MAGTPFSLVAHAPSIEAVLARDRATRTLGEKWAHYLDDELRKTMTGKGLWIESTSLTAVKNVGVIVRGLRLEGPTPQSGA